MMIETQQKPLNKARIKYESEIVDKLQRIYTEKNLKGEQISCIGIKTFNQYHKKQNPIKTPESTNYFQETHPYKDKNGKNWFSKLEFCIHEQEEHLKKYSNLNNEEKIIILLPTLGNHPQMCKEKQVKIYTTQNIEEKKVDELVELFTYNMKLK